LLPEHTTGAKVLSCSAGEEERWGRRGRGGEEGGEEAIVWMRVTVFPN